MSTNGDQPQNTADTLNLKKEDFVSSSEPRWCPGCGDYSVLAQILKILPDLGIPREKYVFVSGIGCSSRFPYYVNTFGFHSIHGRAPAIATGIKAANPDLSVWVITGDGDALSIGGNHFLHAIRRNIDINIILFNNRIYGLTKGQYSPTSEFGKKTKSTPFGSIDYPINPLSVALANEATFVARSIDTEVKHLQGVLVEAARHKGVSFIEVYQNCNIFNDGAFKHLTDKEFKEDRLLRLENQQPLIFGKNRDKGIRMNGYNLEIVELGNGIRESDLIMHDDSTYIPNLAHLLARMDYPDYPVPIGVIRALRRPTYDELMQGQGDEAVKRMGVGNLEKLLESGETWEVK